MVAALRNVELERLVAETPAAVEPYLVYADWLSEHDDPRGQLIHLQLEMEATPTSTELRRVERRQFEEHGRVLLGDFGEWLEDPQWARAVEWRRGFLRRARLSARFDLSGPLLALLRHPVGSVLEELELVGELNGDSGAALLRAVAEHAPVTLRSLEVVGYELSRAADRAPLPIDGWQAILNRQDWRLKRISLDGSHELASFLTTWVDSFASSSLDTLELSVDASLEQRMPAEQTVSSNADRFSRLRTLVLRINPGLLEEGWTPGELGMLSNLQIVPQAHLPHLPIVTLRPFVRLAAPYPCPSCKRDLERVRTNRFGGPDTERWICHLCGRSFVPPRRGHPAHPARPR